MTIIDRDEKEPTNGQESFVLFGLDWGALITKATMTNRLCSTLTSLTEQNENTAVNLKHVYFDLNLLV